MRYLLLLLLISGCAKTVTITSYVNVNGKMQPIRKTVVKQRHMEGNVRFVDQNGPVEIETLLKDDGFSFSELTKGLWDSAVETAKDTLHFNIGDTQSDKTNIHIEGK